MNVIPDPASVGADFCARCGARLDRRPIDGQDREFCPSCGRIAWRNPVPASAAVVIDGDRVLLVRRSIEPYRNSWTLPAGYQEVGEHPATTAERETREESGLIVQAYGLLDVMLTEDDPRKPAILIVYLCRAIGGTAAAADDASEVSYFPIDALPTPIGFANNRRVLERVQREHAAGGIQHIRLPPR